MVNEPKINSTTYPIKTEGVRPWLQIFGETITEIKQVRKQTQIAQKRIASG